MDKDTIEFCWSILQQYLKTNDKQHAADHLIAELVDQDISDSDLTYLKTIDANLKLAIEEYFYEEEHEDAEWD